MSPNIGADSVPANGFWIHATTCNSWPTSTEPQKARWGRIPQVLRELFERYRINNPSTATKRWTEVLALLADAPVAELAQVVTHALARGTDDPAAIALMLGQGRAPTPIAALHASMLPESARCAAPVVDLQAYAIALLMESAA